MAAKHFCQLPINLSHTPKLGFGKPNRFLFRGRTICEGSSSHGFRRGPSRRAGRPSRGWAFRCFPRPASDPLGMASTDPPQPLLARRVRAGLRALGRRCLKLANPQDVRQPASLEQRAASLREFSAVAAQRLVKSGGRLVAGANSRSKRLGRNKCFDHDDPGS